MVANLDLQRVIQAARSGQKLEARKLMAAIVKTNPKHAQAWFILSFLVDDQTQQIDCLQRTLKYAPDHIKAQERLQQIKANSVWQEPSNSSNSDSVPLLTLSHKENTSANRSLPQTNAKVPHSKKLLGRTDNKYSRSLWQINETKEVAQTHEPDILQYLIDDIARLPIITNPHQELWLGVQLRAGKQLKAIFTDWGLQTSTLTFSQFLCLLFLEKWQLLEQQCLLQAQSPPQLEIWASELLTTRRNVYVLHRSRLRGFIRRIQALADTVASQEILTLTFQIAEVLAIFPSETLMELVAFITSQQRLPLLGEIFAGLPLEYKVWEQQVRKQEKQTQQVLTTGYLRYAMRVAQGYVGQGVPYEDLVQAGFIGLSRAAGKFDYRVQARFAVYATSWIWQAIGREIADQGRTIRIPVHVHESFRKWMVALNQFDNGHNDPASDPDILFHAGLLELDDYAAIQEANRSGVTLSEKTSVQYEQAITKAHRLQDSFVHVVSLTELYIDSEPDELLNESESPVEFLPDDNLSIDTIVDISLTQQLIERQVFPFLTEKERQILKLRYGLIDEHEHTLEEIGMLYGLTRERIRQIEARALKKLYGQMARNWLPDIRDLIPEDIAPLLGMATVQVIVPVIKEMEDEDSLQRNRLNQLLSQLPSSNWHQNRLDSSGETRRDQLITVLQELAGPAHVRDIAEQLNGTIPGKELEDTHVYNLLSRDEETFILLGQGIFSLVEWEKARAKEKQPILACCPIPLPDPPEYEDAFFESVLIGQQALAYGLTAKQFVYHMLDWSKTDSEQQKWFLQTILSAYYLVDLIPYAFLFGGDDDPLSCTLPAGSIQDLRYHCLATLTERLIAMPKFWWLLQQHQPIRPSDLGEIFADIHPYGLDDVLQRLRLLTSLGATQKLKYGAYRLTSRGEECANRWKREPTIEVETEQEQNFPNFEDNFASFTTW